MFGFGNKHLTPGILEGLGSAEPIMSESQFGELLMEGSDPHILRQYVDAIRGTVYEDANIPAGYDPALMLAHMAFNGQTETVRRAALIEMLCWMRRVSAYANSTANVIAEFSRAIGNKEADFPQAAELAKECSKHYEAHQASVNGMTSRINERVFSNDVPELLGTKQIIREEIAALVSDAS